MKGRIIYSDNQIQLVAKGRHIFKSSDGGKRWSKNLTLECSFVLKLLLHSNLACRLFRLGFHHFVKMNEHSAVCVFNKEVIWVNLQDGTIIKRDRLYGSRPLSLIHHDNNVYYGEYRSNPERSSVHVWKANITDKTWKSAFEVSGVRHIHGVYYDRYENTFWITTGDENDEAKIILVDEKFDKYEVLLQGSQQSRVVQPVFTEKFVYFCSDAPNEINYIYKYHRHCKTLEPVQRVGGPVYFGQNINGLLTFSTVAEPSDVNSQTKIELWVSFDGTHWRCIMSFKKDMFSLKWFQYGQLFFAKHSVDSDYVNFSEFATVEHLRIHRLKIDEIIKDNF